MMPKLTHSAALQPPEPAAFCDDCNYLWEYCRCGEPTCEDCGNWATRKITVDDCEAWACEKCAAQYELEAAK